MFSHRESSTKVTSNQIEMGTSSSVTQGEGSTFIGMHEEEESMNVLDGALSIQAAAIENFPNSLPFQPNPTLSKRKLCRDSWLEIGKQYRSDDCGFHTQGHTLFFRKFYEKIQQESVKSALNFSFIKLKRISGTHVSINCRFVDYMLYIADTQAEKSNFQKLKFIHQSKGVVSSQYGVLMTTFLKQISESLGAQSSENIIDAWAHLCGFTLLGILSASCDLKEKIII